MTLPPQIRAFVAIPIPEAIRSELARTQDDLRLIVRNVSWTRPDAMHLTLHFFGNVETPRLEAVTAALAGIVVERPVVRLRVRAVGEFGGRVLWAGLEAQVAQLKELTAAIRSAVAQLGFEVEKREFNPHVTLGRMREPSRNLRNQIAALNERSFGEFTARDVELIRSELSPKGSRYTVLERFALRDA
jgi:RNA 2',3'-cyclic 3'-phosphodiesterase